ncbi:MAG: Mannosylfructose-phosphate synthase [candidate division BRC1 bacterium ADurb.BinA364]|nr:MAG: Mannosylfructose-phosphate synthase [candidate division BRC1 bacterium ADurb.BinA364]
MLPNSLLAGLAAPIRARLKAPVLCQLAGEDMFLDDFPPAHREAALRELRRRARDLDGFMAPNRYYADFMAEYLGIGRESIHIAPIGVDTRGYPSEPRSKSGPFVVAYLARICPHKGLHWLAEAFHVLKNDPAARDCRLRVAGYLGPEHKRYFESVKGRLASWGLADSFEHAGQLGREEKVRFLSEASVVVLPSEYPEPKGIPLAEALAAGTPVVAVNSGCFPEWIEATNGGLLAEPKSSVGLASAIAELMRDRSLADRLARQGHRSIHQRFDHHAMAEGALAVFRRFVSSVSAR